jgi:hypothetical protein
LGKSAICALSQSHSRDALPPPSRSSAVASIQPSRYAISSGQQILKPCRFSSVRTNSAASSRCLACRYQAMQSRAHGFNIELASLEIHAIQIRDLELAARGGLKLACELDGLFVVEVEAGQASAMRSRRHAPLCSAVCSRCAASLALRRGKNTATASRISASRQWSAASVSGRRWPRRSSGTIWRSGAVTEMRFRAMPPSARRQQNTWPCRWRCAAAARCVLFRGMRNPPPPPPGRVTLCHG